jgi:hypothetical protein
LSNISCQGKENQKAETKGNQMCLYSQRISRLKLIFLICRKFGTKIEKAILLPNLQQ